MRFIFPGAATTVFALLLITLPAHAGDGGRKSSGSVGFFIQFGWSSGPPAPEYYGQGYYEYCPAPEYWGTESRLPPGLARRTQLPPGLQKHLWKHGSLPPGLQKKLGACGYSNGVGYYRPRGLGRR